MENDETGSTTYGRLSYHYSLAEPTGTDEKLEYDAMRAARRARSKATIIGLFSNAKKNVYDLKTISGLDDKFDFFEVYRDSFCDTLESLGYISDDEYSELLSQMNAYSHFGDFLYDEREQKAEIAAFGLISYERLVLAASEKTSFADFFMEHENLVSCLSYISDGEAISTRARTAALAKVANDPKQKDKSMVRECWDEWKKQPDRYTGKASFARDMLDKFENLKSQPVIERWCREWESAFITQQAP